MRPLEILLILTTLAAAVGLWRALAVRPLRVALTAAPALALALHFGLEGWRWQLLPVYIAVALAVVWLTWARSSRLCSISVILLLLPGAFLTWALPVLQGDPLPGDFAVGVAHHHWVDTERRDEVTAEPRELMLSVWYPASSDTRGPGASYFPDFDQMQPELAAKLGWPSWAVGHFRGFRQRSMPGAQPLSGRFPLVLYSHGLNRNRFEAVFRMEQLASRGFVVVAVDHPYGADFVLFPGGRVQRFRDQRAPSNDLDQIEASRMVHVQRWVEDLRFVLDQVEILQQRGEPVWESANLERIAAMGFSNGGTVAQVLAVGDARIDAVVNLDGTPRGPAVQHVFHVPSLMMHSDPPDASDEDLARWGITRAQLQAPSRHLVERMTQIAGAAKAPAWVVHVRGSAHSNFTDAPRLSPLSHLLGVGGTIDSADAAAMIDGAVYRLLDGALRDGDVVELDQWIDAWSELSSDR